MSSSIFYYLWEFLRSSCNDQDSESALSHWAFSTFPYRPCTSLPVICIVTWSLQTCRASRSTQTVNRVKQLLSKSCFISLVSNTPTSQLCSVYSTKLCKSLAASPLKNFISDSHWMQNTRYHKTTKHARRTVTWNKIIVIKQYQEKAV